MTILCLGLSACASLPNKHIEKINTRNAEYVLNQSSTTQVTVVFENGLTATLDTWLKIFPEIAKKTTAFAYNRPGYGNSDPTTAPREGKYIVNELRDLLHHKGLNPPYILVGHSLGGLYMQLFAKTYPEEICGLVLVDSTHPQEFTGINAPNNWSTTTATIFQLATSANEKKEFNAITQTGRDLLKLPMLSNKPIIILNSNRDSNQQTQEGKERYQKRIDFSILYPSAKLLWVDSGHHIQLERPETVIAAIEEILLSPQCSNDAYKGKT